MVVAALKEAFDRDHARLELERGQLEEERRRAAAALQAELRRQAIDRELGRLRLLAGAAMVGWIASVAIAGEWLAQQPPPEVCWWPDGCCCSARWAPRLWRKASLAGRCQATLRKSMAAAFVAALWLLIAGLAATAGLLL